MWQGKFFGALFGLLITKTLLGAFIGALIGHLLDMEKAKYGTTGFFQQDARAIKERFFAATFQVMGHIAKADGHVSEQEIRAARAVMAHFRLTEHEIQSAIALFTAGKARDFPLTDCVQNLAQLLSGRPDLRLMFIQIQLQAAILSGGLNTYSRAVLQQVCDAMGVSATQLAQLESMLRMQREGPTQPRRNPNEHLQEAYAVLGLTATANDAEVTKAYRRLMNQNHPDKLVAKGLPESMMQAAEEKTRSIRAAYETICEARGIR